LAFVRNLGVGGFGIVDAMQVTESNSKHAVGAFLARKRLNEKWKTNPDVHERFEREIRTVDALDHPAIVTLEGVNIPGAERCYFMPLYPLSLRALLDSEEGKRGFPWRQVARFGARLANALAYAHANGVVHRDLKPENILLSERRDPVITDWGIGHFLHKHSKVLQPALTKAGIGTELYCSMEQWASGAGDVTSDIYSLGIVLAECVLGAPPALAFTGAGIAVDIVPSDSIGAVFFNNAIKSMTAMLSTARSQQMSDVETLLNHAADYDVAMVI
jgi:serine/threonine protein kinase